jgi:response regulator RpfG family c-di-GMP phosphodiesterase
VAKDIVLKGGGTQFDPDVVAAFLRCEPEFRAIATASSDEPAPEPVALSESRP